MSYSPRSKIKKSISKQRQSKININLVRLDVPPSSTNKGSDVPIPRSIKVKDFLTLWDKYSINQRKQVLKRFVNHFKPFIIQNENWSLDIEIGEIANLFYSRLVSFFQIKLRFIQTIFIQTILSFANFLIKRILQYIENCVF